MTKSTHSEKRDISQITTYQSGIVQSSAHRVLNRVTSDYLLRYGLSSMQWFMIGSIYDAGTSGVRLSDLMRRMNTTLPYITNTISLLESKRIVNKITHSGDSRIKLVSIAPSYISTIGEIEDGLRDHLRAALYKDGHITRDELSAYITVLYKLAQQNQ